MRIHGNYVGPNWSAGKRQRSVRYGRVPAVDEFDLSGKFHDHAYATGMDRKKADYLFYKWNVGKGPVRTAAALAVGGQSFLRSSEKNNYMYTPPRTPRGTVKFSSRVKGNEANWRPVANKRRIVLGKTTKKAGMRKTKTRQKVVLVGAIGKKFSNKGSKIGKPSLLKKFGVMTIREDRGTATSASCVYLGHASVARDLALRSVAFAIVKMVAFKAGFDVSDFEKADTFTFTEGTWQVKWRRGQDQGDSIQSGDIYIPTVAYTLANVVNVLTLFLVQTGNSETPNFSLVEFSFIPVASARYSMVRLNLQNASIEVDWKTMLKIQNRTTSASGSLSTDIIDVNPLMGRSYMGKGTGTTLNITRNLLKPLIADIQGLISYDGQSLDCTKEPVPGSAVTNATRTRAIKQAPGEIRTSYLNCKKKLKLNKLILLLGTQRDPIDLHHFLNIGSFKVMAFEKVMFTPGDSSLVTIGYELQKNYICRIYNVNPLETAQEVILPVV